MYNARYRLYHTSSYYFNGRVFFIVYIGKYTFKYSFNLQWFIGNLLNMKSLMNKTFGYGVWGDLERRGRDPDPTWKIILA